MPELRVRLETVNLGRRTALHGVSFRCAEGCRLAVLGPNGAGKTTLLRSLAGLLPYVGEVHLGEQRLGSLAPRELARSIAYVPQRSELDVALPVRDVVMQGRYCHQDGFGRVTPTDRAAVDGAMDSLDVTTIADRDFTQLSGGEQRRVLLARALATGAQVILLDEPTAALDLAHALALFEHLHQLAKAGKIVISVLHQLADAERFSDTLCLLHQGELQSYGPPPLSETLLEQVYGVQVWAERQRAFALPNRTPREDAP